MSDNISLLVIHVPAQGIFSLTNEVTNCWMPSPLWSGVLTI